MPGRLTHVRRITRDRFRLTLDRVEPDRARWQHGDGNGAQR